VLAGGNNAFRGKPAPDGVEDGILTASEISKLNFFDTKLAVLSACQTGLGDVKGNEGVYGLQRAFKMAGTDYIIFSLWEVPDKATQELMTSFYENWFSGMEIRDAFKAAQNTLKDKYKDVPGSAFAWAAFVLLK
jgi:CHAT domain-containing protein